jgi:hypothetical protein
LLSGRCLPPVANCGPISEFAIWNGLLSLQDMKSLSTSTRPCSILPRSNQSPSFIKPWSVLSWEWLGSPLAGISLWMNGWISERMNELLNEWQIQKAIRSLASLNELF